jgi:hypothetical protein
LEGWGAAEFQTASPDLLAAARWALFARRVAPMLGEQRAQQAANLHALRPAAKLVEGVAKRHAGVAIPILEALLYPPGDD